MKTAAVPFVTRVGARKRERARVSEAYTPIDDHRTGMCDNRTPDIDFIVDTAAAQRWGFYIQHATRDRETGFGELHFDLADYNRVQGLPSRERPVWVGEDPGLEG